MKNKLCGDCCGDCTYFHPTKDRLAGECRIYPPKAAIGGTTNYWPKVDALDWCGQFMSAENLYKKKKK